MSRTTGRPAEVLRNGSSITVEATAGDGLTISTYIRMPGIFPGNGAPHLIYHQGGGKQ